MDLRPFYFNALENMGRIFAGARASQLDGATPCEGWNTRDLMNHIVGGTVMFAHALDGEDMTGRTVTGDIVGDDPASVFEGARKTAIDAWNAEGALERTTKIIVGEMPATIALRVALMEAVVHGWDLAKATDQPHGIEPMIAMAMLDGLRKTITPEQRGPGKFFEEEVAVPADAPIEEQLVAFLGRKP